jgi:nuclear pore complex protein Nup107
MLPPELAAIGTPEERAAEYLDYRQFFIAWETLERVTECQALEAPQVSRNTHATWVKDYGVRALFIFPFPPVCFSSNRMQGLVSSAREQILKLLTMDWLVLENDATAST